MKKQFKLILATLLLLTCMFSCKKNSPSPEQPILTQEQTYDTIILPIDTTSVITPTVPVNTNTITVSIYMKTISGNYNGTMVPTYYGNYKVDFLIHKNGSFVQSIQPAPIVLNCTCNPRTIYIPGFKSGDTITVYWSLQLAGSVGATGLPSVVYNYKQGNIYDSGFNCIYQSKQGHFTYTIQ